MERRPLRGPGSELTTPAPAATAAAALLLLPATLLVGGGTAAAARSPGIARWGFLGTGSGTRAVAMGVSYAQDAEIVAFGSRDPVRAAAALSVPLQFVMSYGC